MIDRNVVMKDSNIKKFNVNLVKGICPNKCVWCFVPWIEKKTYFSLETMKSFIDLNKDEKIFTHRITFNLGIVIKSADRYRPRKLCIAV